MISAPSARTSAGFIPLTVPAVPTGMNAGVRISPRAVWMAPVRADPSVAAILKSNLDKMKARPRWVCCACRSRHALNHDRVWCAHASAWRLLEPNARTPLVCTLVRCLPLSHAISGSARQQQTRIAVTVEPVAGCNRMCVRRLHPIAAHQRANKHEQCRPG